MQGRLELILLTNCYARTNHLLELERESWLSLRTQKLIVEATIVRCRLGAQQLFDSLVLFWIESLLCR